jgi:hypothetical protein
LLVAVVLYVGVLIGVQTVHEQVLRGEAIYRPGDDYHPGDRLIGAVVRLADGSLIPPESADLEFNEDGTVTVGGQTGEWVQLVIPGERYAEVSGREALGLGGVTVVAIGGAGIAVNRRRP